MGTSPDQLKQDIEDTRAGLTHNVDTLAEKVSPSSIASRRVEDARGVFNNAKDRVMGSSLTDRASSVTDSVTDTVSSAPDAVRAKAQGSPLAAGVIAFGAGLLVSSLMPATEKEQHAAVALKEKAEPLTNQATEEVKAQPQQLKEAITPAAQDAAQQVKSTAQDAATATKEQAASARDDLRGGDNEGTQANF